MWDKWERQTKIEWFEQAVQFWRRGTRFVVRLQKKNIRSGKRNTSLPHPPSPSLIPHRSPIPLPSLIPHLLPSSLSPPLLFPFPHPLTLHPSPLLSHSPILSPSSFLSTSFFPNITTPYHPLGCLWVLR